MENTNRSEAGRVGFRRSLSPEAIDKMRQLGPMIEKFNSLPKELQNKPEVKDFFQRYGDFMSSDNYRADRPNSFLNQADAILGEGSNLLDKLNVE